MSQWLLVSELKLPLEIFWPSLQFYRRGAQVPKREKGLELGHQLGTVAAVAKTQHSSLPVQAPFHFTQMANYLLWRRESVRKSAI